ncbi:TetR/AcrR family transcriptional regulator [Propionibacterium acidifaciens]
MPRINAPTVREHHEQVMTSLIDAAEQILREEGPGALTAGAVSSRAGVARNSIYRYVESIDDLRGLVVERYMPGWFDAVQEAMDASEDPHEQLVAWAIANLEQATIAGHGWLMRIGEGRLKPNAARTVGRAHAALYAGLDRLWGRINPDRARIASIMTQGLLVAMMNAVERRTVGLDEAREELRGAVLLLIDRYEVDDRGGRPAG